VNEYLKKKKLKKLSVREVTSHFWEQSVERGNKGGKVASQASFTDMKKAEGLRGGQLSGVSTN
jgi:hypothetical protein